MAQTAPIPEPLAPIVDRIVEVMAPEAIWLFGSRARGDEQEGSDYDLLAVMPDGTPKTMLNVVEVFPIVVGFGVPVDLVPCTRSAFERRKHEANSLPNEAFTRGVKLYDRAA